jgi:hypothetical protein
LTSAIVCTYLLSHSSGPYDEAADNNTDVVPFLAEADDPEAGEASVEEPKTAEVLFDADAIEDKV